MSTFLGHGNFGSRFLNTENSVIALRQRCKIDGGLLAVDERVGMTAVFVCFDSLEDEEGMIC